MTVVLRAWTLRATWALSRARDFGITPKTLLATLNL